MPRVVSFFIAAANPRRAIEFYRNVFEWEFNGGEIARGKERMVLDAYRQVTRTAGDYQVENARNVATLNIGGSGTTSVSFVIGAN